MTTFTTAEPQLYVRDLVASSTFYSRMLGISVAFMHGDPPFYGQIENGHNMHELRSMWKRVHKIIEEIIELRLGFMAQGDHQYLAPPTPGRHCTWACDFYPVCSMMDDGSNWEGLLDEYYTHVDPHERYAAQDQGREVTE